jgi:5-deoxy-D-glucuronate isomerase
VPEEGSWVTEEGVQKFQQLRGRSERETAMLSWSPRGYHPVVVPHGYESYYFNVLAGPKRVWHFHNDPAHEWILAEA